MLGGLPAHPLKFVGSGKDRQLVPCPPPQFPGSVPGASPQAELVPPGIPCSAVKAPATAHFPQPGRALVLGFPVAPRWRSCQCFKQSRVALGGQKFPRPHETTKERMQAGDVKQEYEQQHKHDAEDGILIWRNRVLCKAAVWDKQKKQGEVLVEK